MDFYDPAASVPQAAPPMSSPMGNVAADSVYLVNPMNNQVVPVAPGYIGDALRMGWQDASPDQVSHFQNLQNFGGIGGAALSAIQGLDDGLFFGGGQWLAARTGLVNADTMAAIRDIQPEANMVGFGAGLIIPALLTGGASVEAQAAKAATRAAAGAREIAGAEAAAKGLGGAEITAAIKGAGEVPAYTMPMAERAASGLTGRGAALEGAESAQAHRIVGKLTSEGATADNVGQLVGTLGTELKAPGRLAQAASYTAPEVIARLGDMAGMGAAKMTPEALKPFVSHIMKGAVEGGIWSNQRLLTDIITGDTDLSTENAVRQLLHNTVLGVAAGGVLGGVGAGINKGIGSVAESQMGKMREAGESLVTKSDVKARVTKALEGSKIFNTIEGKVYLSPEAENIWATEVANAWSHAAKSQSSLIDYGLAGAGMSVLSNMTGEAIGGMLKMGIVGTMVGGLRSVAKQGYETIQNKIRDNILTAIKKDVINSFADATYKTTGLNLAGIETGLLTNVERLVFKASDAASNIVNATTSQAVPKMLVDNNNYQSIMNVLSGTSPNSVALKLPPLSATINAAMTANVINQTVQNAKLAQQPTTKQPSLSELLKFNNSVLMLVDPIGTIEWKAAQGTLTRADIALADVAYPSHMQAIRSELMDKVADAEVNQHYIDRQTKQMVSIVLGLPDTRINAIPTGPAEAPQQAPTRPPPQSSRAVGKISLGTRLAPPTSSSTHLGSK